MKLLGSDNSPFVRKCHIVLEEKRASYDFVAASPSNPASGVAAANPLSKIPTLVRDDGKGLYDSAVIVDYVDGLVPTPRLIPEAFADRIEVKRWEALGDGVAEAAVELAHDRRRPADRRLGAEVEDKQMKKIVAGLAVMEADLGGRDFCYGNAFSLADIACGVALFYLDRVTPELQWRDSHPNLKRHAERMGQRPSFAKTTPSPA